jgi:transketolase
LPEFQPVRQLLAARNAKPKLTVAGIGPVLLNTLPWLGDNPQVDLFAVSQLPLPALDSAFAASVAASGQLLVIEEHVARGGLGEHLAAALARAGVHFKLHHRCAAGYPTGRYGSQRFHQQQSGLDAGSLQATVTGLIS